MTINNKFNVQDRVWVVMPSTHTDTVEVFDEEISSIIVNKDNNISYYLMNMCDEYKEEDLVAFDDTVSLITKIHTIIKKIHEEAGTLNLDVPYISEVRQ